MSKVTIIMAVYNGARYLKEAIKSVLAQTHGDFELLCLDDASTDESSNVIRSFADSRIKLHRYEKNHGSPAPLRNDGIRVSRGEFIAFIDQDDIYYSDSLQARLEHFAAHPETVFVYADCSVIDSTGKSVAPSLIAYTGKKPHEGRCFRELFKGIFIPIQGVMVRRSVFDTVGLFNEALTGTEDYEMWLRIAYWFPISFVSTTLAMWRDHAVSLSKKTAVMDMNFVRCLESVLASFPQARSLVGRDEADKRMYQLTFDVAYYYYTHDPHNARPWLMKCLKYKPNLKDALRVLATFIPLRGNGDCR